MTIGPDLSASWLLRDGGELSGAIGPDRLTDAERRLIIGIMEERLVADLLDDLGS